jgi:hypothetical protein
MNTPDLQNAVRQALTQNAGGSPAQNQFQHGMNMQNAFMPQQHWNQNFQYGNDPLKQNPYAFVQEKPDSYFTVFPDPSRYAPQISQGQYNAMMQQDYGQNPNVNTEPQAPAAPAAPNTTMDYTKWLDGSIWDQEITHRNTPMSMTLGSLADGGSSGGWSGQFGWGDAAKYAPPKPGEGATNQDWIAYNTAKNMWNERIDAGKSRYDSIMQGN